jgi:hypothetical protein
MNAGTCLPLRAGRLTPRAEQRSHQHVDEANLCLLQRQFTKAHVTYISCAASNENTQANLRDTGRFTVHKGGHL